MCARQSLWQLLPRTRLTKLNEECDNKGCYSLACHCVVFHYPIYYIASELQKVGYNSYVIQQQCIVRKSTCTCLVTILVAVCVL